MPRTPQTAARTRTKPARMTVKNGYTLASELPTYVNQLHPTLNGTPPEEFAATIAPYGLPEVWWLCPKGHAFEMPVVKRTRRGDECGVCRKERFSLRNVGGLLAEEFAADKNPGMSLDTVTANAEYDVIWRCRAAGHEWPAHPANRTRRGVKPCPFCTGLRRTADQMLPHTHPHIAAEYHPTLNDTPVTEISAGADKARYWQCPANRLHVWLVAPYARTRPAGSGCPVCNKHSWTPNAVLGALAALIADSGSLDGLSVTERRVLLARVGVDRPADPGQKDALAAFSAGGMSTAELYLAAGGSQDELDRVRAIRAASRTLEDDPAGAAPRARDEAGEEASAREPGLRELHAPDEPFADLLEDAGQQAQAVLAVLDSALVSAVTADGETLDYLLCSGIAKLWLTVSDLPAAARETFVATMPAPDGPNGEHVRAQFITEYHAAAALQPPASWRHKYQPLLMQRLTALRVLRDRRVANWSGTGAGKTLSAVLAAGVLNARTTLVVCPNAVVEGWAKEINAAYPYAKVAQKSMLPNWDQVPGSADAPRFLVVNYEALQQHASRARADTMLARERIDFAVIDELHNVKQREQAANESRRKALLSDILAKAAERNPAMAVLAMTATPVLNDLHEARSLVELVTGQTYPELATRPNLENAFRIHALLAKTGLRLSGERVPREIVPVEVDASHLLDQVLQLGPIASPLELDRLLTQARLPQIVQACTEGEPVLVYTHYVDGIVPMLTGALRSAGLRVAEYTGTHKNGLEEFRNQNADVLVASAPISTGVDGLQYVCRRLVVNVPPWTAAEFEQLVGRLARQGQPAERVDVLVPTAHISVGDDRWSWDANRMARLEFKAMLAAAAVDGIAPEGEGPSEAQVLSVLREQLHRLAEQVRAGQVTTLVHPAATSTLTAVERPVRDLIGPRRDYGPLARAHSMMNRSYSATTATRFATNPNRFDDYHIALDATRPRWQLDPVAEAVALCRELPGVAVADFGCGRTPRLALALAGTHTVHSFDHQSRHPLVTAGDMVATGLPAGSVDIAVFSLSLMGANAADYLREAHRVLRPGGLLLVWEAASRIRSTARFVGEVEMLGFTDVTSAPEGTFLHVAATRAEAPGPAWARLTFTSSAA